MRRERREFTAPQRTGLPLRHDAGFGTLIPSCGHAGLSELGAKVEHQGNIERPSVEIVAANLELAEHQRAIVELLDAYAADPIIDGKPLSAQARRDMIPGLMAHPTTLVFLALCDAQPVGVAVCFRGFSTFYAQPLINIHDLAVLADFRGRGIGRRLLDAVERAARDSGCCKLTLEVRESNTRAKGIYESIGFSQGQIDGEGSGFLFLAKSLDEESNGEPGM